VKSTAKSPLDPLVCLSVANLLFIRIWLKILPYNQGSNFFLPFSPLNTYLAAMLNVLAWGGLLFLALNLCRGSRAFPWLVLGVFFVTALLVAYGVGVSFISVGKFIFLFGHRLALALFAGCWLAAVVGIWQLVKHRRRLSRRYALLPLLFSPYLLATFGESIQAIARVEPSSHFLPHAVTPARPLKNPLPVKVVWVIFDETDYRLCFEKRPGFLKLPAFDRFRGTALFATQAYSPNDNTQTSLPSLLTGEPLVRTVQQGAAKVDLVRPGSLARTDFAAADTIFKEIKKRGGSTALFGWFLPYARTLHALDLCGDYARYNVATSESLWKVFLTQSLEIFDFRFLPFSDTLLGRNQIGIVRRMTGDVAAAMREQDATFTFLHYSVPHSPNVYDRKSGRLAFNRDKREGYFDNVALADRCLAELRREMEAKGSWDRSLVIVSSDHHWRTNTYDQELDRQHVPFLAKFPQQRQPFLYQGKFNTVLTKSLVLQVVDGRISSPQQAASWLDQRMLEGKTPVAFSAEEPDAD